MSSNEIWSWDVKKWMAAGDIYINGITAVISIYKTARNMMMKSRKSWRYTSIGTRVLTQGCDYMTGCLHQHALSNRTPKTEKTKCKCENGAHYRCVWQFYRWKWKLWALPYTLKLNRVPDNRALFRYFKETSFA